MSIRFALCSLLLTIASPALAEEPVGIAFVQAPEQGGGVCVADTAKKGFACAVKECMESGAQDEDCLRTNWCQPAGWSVDVFLVHNEGVHWHEVSCGWATKPLAMKAASLICDDKERQFIVGCMISEIYDPEGKPQLK